jgi:hypothetical protein
MLRTIKQKATIWLCMAVTVSLITNGMKCQGINQAVLDQDAKDNRTNFCEGIDVNYTLMSDREIEIQRNKDINLFHKSTDLLKELITTKDYVLLWDGTLWLPILITIIFTFSIISLLLYLFNIFICCKRTKSDSAGMCVKLNLCFAVVALVIFLISIIGMSIFISNARSSIQYVNCSFNIMNDDLRNGAEYSDANVKFQGMLPLQNIFTGYGATLVNLVKNHVDNINNIVGKQLPSLAKTAVDAVEPYYNTYKTSTTSDPDGVKSTPNSITNILPGGKIAMDAEFAKLYDASTSLHAGALVAKSVIDTGDSAIFESAIKSANTELDEVLTSINKYITMSNDYFGNVTDKYDAVQIVYIVFNFLCLIVAIVIIVGLCCIYHKDKCKIFVLWRVLIFVIGLLCVLFFAVTFVISGLSFATSSACQMFSELHSDQGIDDFVTTFEITEKFKIVLKTCYAENGTGDLGNVFLKENATNSPEFQVYNDSLALLSVYENYETERATMNEQGDATSTQDVDDAFEKIRIGINEDYTNVFSTLSKLNGMVNCDNVYYALTPNTCAQNTALTCLTIQDSATFNVPICLSGQGTVVVAEATDLFTKLKNYLTETQALMANMIDDANGTKTESLNSKYKVAALAFLDAAKTFDLIKEDQKDILATFSGDLTKQTDCRIVRLHLQIIEDAICFNVVAELYSFMVASLVGSIFFFCFVWNLCCAEYCLWNELEGEEQEEEVEVYESHEAKPIIIPTEPQNDVAEDDFFINNAQGGYMNDSESANPQDQNVEYKEAAQEDDFMAPNTGTDKGKIQ